MTTQQHETEILHFCARFFREPSRLVRATRVRFERPVTLSPHWHDDWLQLDLSLGCAGQWRSAAGDERVVSGTTLTAFYPREMHGFELEPVGAQGEVLSLKLRVDPAWPEVQARLFPPLVQGICGCAPLVDSLRTLAQIPGTSTGVRPPLAIVALARALCLWPRNRQSRPPNFPNENGKALSGAECQPALQQVLNAIETRLASPPTIEELAGQVHFSSRHLSRLFRDQFGCTIHYYIDSCRMQRACELLLQGQLTVTQVAEAVGFVSIHSFSRWFRRQTGVAPGQYAVSQLVL